jgi:hypothetical protein
MEPEVMEAHTPEWHDLHSSEELAAALDYHGVQIAKRYGAYDIANEIRLGAECIRDLSDRLEMAIALTERLQVNIEKVQRKAEAALASFAELA